MTIQSLRNESCGGATRGTHLLVFMRPRARDEAGETTTPTTQRILRYLASEGERSKFHFQKLKSNFVVAIIGGAAANPP